MSCWIIFSIGKALMLQSKYCKNAFNIKWMDL